PRRARPYASRASPGASARRADRRGRTDLYRPRYKRDGHATIRLPIRRLYSLNRDSPRQLDPLGEGHERYPSFVPTQAPANGCLNPAPPAPRATWLAARSSPRPSHPDKPRKHTRRPGGTTRSRAATSSERRDSKSGRTDAVGSLE